MYVHAQRKGMGKVLRMELSIRKKGRKADEEIYPCFEGG